jgi:hypothetical protein
MDKDMGKCLAIVGSRNLTDKKLFLKHVNLWIEKYGKMDIIVSGGAKGADTLAREYSLENKIPFEEYHADWNTYGKKAGPIRNTQIVNLCNYILAFPSKKGKGTQDIIKKATQLKKNITIHYID